MFVEWGDALNHLEPAIGSTLVAGEGGGIGHFLWDGTSTRRAAFEADEEHRVLLSVFIRTTL